jgi:hypothetical protein
MNLNIIGYVVYLLFTAFIIVRVGKICYDNGNLFVSQLIPDHEDLCHKINRILLVGYYLINIGYCAITIIGWQKIDSLQVLIEIVAFRASLIICFIALMHYLNIFIITKYVQKLIH